jgi:superfamily I DNA/RNA helicase
MQSKERNIRLSTFAGDDQSMYANRGAKVELMHRFRLIFLAVES